MPYDSPERGYALPAPSVCAPVTRTLPRADVEDVRREGRSPVAVPISISGAPEGTPEMRAAGPAGSRTFTFRVPVGSEQPTFAPSDAQGSTRSWGHNPYTSLGTGPSLSWGHGGEYFNVQRRVVDGHYEYSVQLGTRVREGGVSVKFGAAHAGLHLSASEDLTPKLPPIRRAPETFDIRPIQGWPNFHQDLKRVCDQLATQGPEGIGIARDIAGLAGDIGRLGINPERTAMLQDALKRADRFSYARQIESVKSTHTLFTRTVSRLGEDGVVRQVSVNQDVESGRELTSDGIRHNFHNKSDLPVTLRYRIGDGEVQTLTIPAGGHGDFIASHGDNVRYSLSATEERESRSMVLRETQACQPIFVRGCGGQLYHAGFAPVRQLTWVPQISRTTHEHTVPEREYTPPMTQRGLTVPREVERPRLEHGIVIPKEPGDIDIKRRPER